MTSRTSICLLTCIEDAQALLAENSGTLSGWRLFANHGSVVAQLAESGVACEELASLVPASSVFTISAAADCVNPLLAKLDERFATTACGALGVPPTNLFAPLFRYAGKHDYVGARKLHEALMQIIDGDRPERIRVYEGAETGINIGAKVLTRVAQQMGRDLAIQIEVDTTSRPEPRQPERSPLRRLAGILSDPPRLRRRIRDDCWNLFRTISSRLPRIRARRILLVEPLYELEFLREELHRDEVIQWLMGSTPPYAAAAPIVPEAVWEALELLLGELAAPIHAWIDLVGDTCLRMLADMLIELMRRRMRSDLSHLSALHQFHVRKPIDLMIWGVPPVWTSEALLPEYLLSRKVPVLGMQHGGVYGVQNTGWTHLDSDFSRCTHFLSYGVGHDEMQSLYSGVSVPCQIIPVGSNKEHSRRAGWDRPKSERIAILFAITCTASLSQEGAFRRKADELTSIQRRILARLDSITGRSVVVKPMTERTPRNCAVMRELQSLSRAQLLLDVTLKDALDRFEVGAVVLESPAGALWEVLGRNTEVFLLLDPHCPFTTEAFELLKRRVHTFDDVEALNDALGAWVSGNLPSRRDGEFYAKYVFRPDTPSRILSTINSLLDRSAGGD